MQDKTIQFSKFLSYVLRHKPEAISLTLDQDGWVNVDDLLLQANRHGKKLTREILEYVVENNNKKRFTFNTEQTMIRAAQGHSTQQVNLNHLSHTPPEFLYHGTAIRFVDSIRQQGLLAGNRHHVHLSDNTETATNVGSRHGKPIVLVIEAKKMVESGYLFYLSDNHVWLTEHVPAKFIQP
ncbi:RNA 2'-phosphotransferase [Providencia vermicola]|uniref:RNA 2'-phosphotransferase n=1 Tax=Providencia vermicola TaxID=333965 RepID=UPI001CEC3EE4|nr:RNA 2'-phosphotransferase [Providencia vermicola]